MPTIQLSRSRASIVHLVVAFFVLGLACLAVQMPRAAAGVALLAVLLLPWATSQIAPRQQRFPSKAAGTVKDLYRAIRDENLYRLRSMSGQLVDNTDVWNGLRCAIVDALGVDDEEVTPDARLFADLGCA